MIKTRQIAYERQHRELVGRLRAWNQSIISDMRETAKFGRLQKLLRLCFTTLFMRSKGGELVPLSGVRLKFKKWAKTTQDLSQLAQYQEKFQVQN